MRIIVDFDYTLFNVEALRTAMITTAQQCAGVTEQQFRSTELQVKEELGVYEPQRHSTLLVADALQRQQMFDAWMVLVDNGVSFLYPDAVEFLRRYESYNIVLLSFGNKEWQRRKIVGTGVADLVDDVVVTTDPKQTAFPTLVTSAEPVVVVNDRGSELDALKRLHPSAIAVWVRRPDDPYAQEPCSSATVVCSDLTIDLNTYT